MTIEGLIDRIYEAAVLSDEWPSVLESISDMADGDGALLFTQRMGENTFIGAGRAVKFFEETITGPWLAYNDRPARLFAAKHAGFLTDLDVYTREEIERHPYFVEFLRPRGFGWGTATAISVPNGDTMVINVERRFSRGPVEREIVQQLDRLRPHLARAVVLSASLSLERARNVTAVLDLVGLPAAVLGRAGRLLAVNTTFEYLMPKVARERRERLELENPNADTLFSDALQRLAPTADDRSVRSIPVAATDDFPPIVLHIIPMRARARDLFSGSDAVLIVTPVVAKEVPSYEVVQVLFDLTPAEARVARSIAGQQSIDEIAAAAGVSRETVRTQLKAVLAKTGLRRQIDLAAMLAGVSLFPRKEGK